jgi:hypothetical protein
MGNHVFGTRKKYRPVSSLRKHPSPLAREKERDREREREKLPVIKTSVFQNKSLCLPTFSFIKSAPSPALVSLRFLPKFLVVTFSLIVSFFKMNFLSRGSRFS